MNKIIKLSLSLVALVLAVGMIASCKKTFDAPPPYISPNLTATSTIMALKTKYASVGSGTSVVISDNTIIEGVVIADDRSGNFFKSIVIQDSTGAIIIQLADYNLYTSYAIGTQVWIKCNGIYIGNFNGSIQLGGGTGASSSGKPIMAGIPKAIIQNYVVAGTPGNKVDTIAVTASQLTTALLSPLQYNLIKLSGYQIGDLDTTRTYADPSNLSTTAGSIYPQDCSGSKNTTLELYNSNFAYFAGLPLPTGNGNFIGVYSVYGTYKQIQIRDTSDLQFYGPRCGTGGGGGGTGGGSLITLTALRALYPGSDLTLAAGTQITGVVISDATNKNISTGAVDIQQTANGVVSGMSVYFGGTITYKIGDSLVINVGGSKLTNYKGSLEVSTPVGTAKPSAVSTGNAIIPQVKTIADLKTALAKPLTDPGNIEYTVVQIVGATASPSGSTFGGNRTITDASGNMTLYTAAAATFAGTNMPTAPLTWTGYCNNFNTTAEFQIRNNNDYQ